MNGTLSCNERAPMDPKTLNLMKISSRALFPFGLRILPRLRKALAVRAAEGHCRVVHWLLGGGFWDVRVSDSERVKSWKLEICVVTSPTRPIMGRCGEFRRQTNRCSTAFLNVPLLMD